MTSLARRTPGDQGLSFFHNGRVAILHIPRLHVLKLRYFDAASENISLATKASPTHDWIIEFSPSTGRARSNHHPATASADPRKHTVTTRSKVH